MYYFLTHNIGDKLAGLEIAMINRVKIFNYLGLDNKIVTFYYNRELHRYLEMWGISEHNFINLFDYLQKATNSEDIIRHNEIDTVKETLVKELSDDITIYQEKNSYRLVANAGQVRRVIDLFDDQHVSRIMYFDQHGNLEKKTLFDIRGFKSMDVFFDQRGNLFQEIMYTISGEKVFESYYKFDDATQRIENTVRKVYIDQHIFFFKSLEKLTAWFYDELANQPAQTTFIADRSYMVDAPLFDMKKSVKKVEFWHNTFTKDYLPDGELVEVLQNELKHRDNLNTILVPTKAEAEDLNKRVNTVDTEKVIPVLNIPVALNDEHNQMLVTDSTVDPYRIVMVARIEQQKNIASALFAFLEVLKSIPEASLHIYGYILEASVMAELREIVKSQGIENHVHFENYTPNKHDIYRHASQLWLTSRNEGWGMVLNEAMTYGIPVLSYDINYGPSEIIEHGVNGYLVEFNDYKKLAQYAVTLMTDKTLWKKMSYAARQHADKFTLEKMGAKWRNVLAKLDTFGVAK